MILHLKENELGTTVPCVASISRKKKSTPKKLQARPEKYTALKKIIST